MRKLTALPTIFCASICALLLLSGCNSSGDREALTKELLALFSKTRAGSQPALEEAVIRISDKRYVFHLTADRVTLARLNVILSSGYVSGSSEEVREHGRNMIEIGEMTLRNATGRVSFDLFRSRSHPELFAVKVPDPGFGGSSITYFNLEEAKLTDALGSPDQRISIVCDDGEFRISQIPARSSSEFSTLVASNSSCAISNAAFACFG